MRQRRVHPDRAIVTRFIDYLRAGDFPELQIDRWPEDHNPGQSEVEAVAGNLAIEHTSVDTLPEQRRIGEQFQEALGSLERLPVAARLNILVPYELVTVGTDWDSFRLALAHWIVDVAPSLPDGVHNIDMPGTLLRCTGRKARDRPPGVFFARPEPDDHTLAQRVGAQIARKMKKLLRYKAEGYTTVLILETQDQSLMNQHRMLEAVREGVGGAMPTGLDQLWFTEANGCAFFDFTEAITTGSDTLY